MPPLNAYNRPYGVPGQFYKYYTVNDPWAEFASGGINNSYQPRSKSGASGSTLPVTPPATGRKRPNKGGPSNVKVKFPNLDQDDVMEDVPGFDGRSGGGGRRRPRKGNGKRAAGRRPRRKARKVSKRKRTKKITAKKRLPKKTSILRNGVYRSEYQIGTLTSSGERAIYIGHSNVVQKDMRLVFCYAIVKNVLQRAGVEVKTMNDPPRGIELDDNFTVTYRTGNTAGISATTFNVTSVAAAMSTYGDAFDAFLAGLTNEDQVILESFTFTPALVATSTIPRVAITLRNAKVMFDLQSEFRVQNETVIGTNIETTDVAAVDLIGKYYTGKGTGTAVLNDRDMTTPLVCNSGTGVIAKATSTAVNSIIRPLDAQILSNCQKSGPFAMKAGSDFKSVIKGKYTAKIDNLMRVINVDNQPTYPVLNVGQYRMYGLEKKFYNGTDQAIVRYTNRMTIGCTIKYFKSKLTSVTNV